MRRLLRAGATAIVLAMAIGPAAAAAPSVPGLAWVARYDSPAHRNDGATALAVAPNGSRVYVTGNGRSRTLQDFVTIAYRADGSQAWMDRYDGPAHGYDYGCCLAVSPDGARLYMTGQSPGGNGYDITTIAFDAATGARQWVARWDGSGFEDTPAAIAINAAGTRLFITGLTSPAFGTDDYATLALNASTGQVIWEATYEGPGHDLDEATALALSPGEDSLYVTGTSWGGDGAYDYATVAYDVTTGQQLAVARFDGTGHDYDQARSVAVGPSGRVFVTGESWGLGSTFDQATVAYPSGLEGPLWTYRYDGPAAGDDGAEVVLASPDGAREYVAGRSAADAQIDWDYATTALDAGTGQRVWVRRFAGPGGAEDVPNAMALSPDATRLFVTGQSRGDGTGLDYATIGYAASSGSVLGLARYNGPGSSDDFGQAIGVGPGGSRVYVTGSSLGTLATRADFATVAYDL